MTKQDGRAYEALPESPFCEQEQQQDLDKPATLKDLQEIKNDMKTMKNDMKNDMEAMKNDMEAMKNDIMEAMRKDREALVRELKGPVSTCDLAYSCGITAIYPCDH